MARRMKWGSLEDLRIKIDTYFETESIPTDAGFCLFMGITKDCFNYYKNDRYKYKHKSEDEKAEILKEIETEADEKAEMEALEDFLTIAPDMEVIDNYDACSKYDKNVEDTIKRQLSAEFKKVFLRLEDFNQKAGYTAKNPAYAIFTAKALFGYRETAPEQSNSNQLPSKITIQIMPAPDKTELQQPTKVSINASSE
ncbi:hypothetical protein Cpap_1512 [Ruminiclostridium papyrosolvens DSM 2782]|uniref:Uncharacterized protein n=1 Tax=Ruminiclostridium papyrosolvens DSM 2782 TaxID=588581 RepID=F1TEF4_9FIRM|nr:hypothetical protein [Ruminiclostridium papyrosolvens]EGD47120.1 hypothetical protein Cpap_1512 [Ruminiclostridium papyrosolvens DSM 2782]WES36062.1 hypothetical protein P0092_08895 [Ruminiclostridium papyrosolvens DSM 2782]WES36160.1 hypothetical protein P0092_09395 [Ruminiclostridium papyrosolvens DSM 2782]